MLHPAGTVLISVIRQKYSMVRKGPSIIRILILLLTLLKIDKLVNEPKSNERVVRLSRTVE